MKNHCLAIEELVRVSPTADVVIVGDYNMPLMGWRNVGDRLLFDINRACGMTDQANVLMQFFNEFGFFQHNNITNHKSNMLDMVFSGLRDIVVSLATDVLMKCDLHHPALIISLPKVMRKPSLLNSEWKYNFVRAD